MKSPVFPKTRVSRRQILGSAVRAAASVSPLIYLRAFAQSRPRLTLCAFLGGSFGQAMEAAIIKPFQKETGITVDIVTTPDLGALRDQVDKGAVTWDVMECVGSMVYAGSRDGLWDPMTDDLLAQSSVNPGTKRDALGYYYYSGGLAWDPRNIHRQRPPSTFADFWDIRQYPGWRALRTRASETFEAALLADGVKPQHVYPLDVDRAFRSLEKIRPHVRKWVTDTTQTIGLLQAGEVDFSYTYQNRVLAARASGSRIGFSIDQNIVASSYYALPKGSPNREQALKYLNFVLRPDRQAALADLALVAPVNAKAMPLLSKRSLSQFIYPNKATHVKMNDQWWADHFVELDARFKRWIAR